MLRIIICKKFLGMEIKDKLPENLEVPKKGFDLLFAVARIVRYSDDMIKLINKNMPPSYDTSDLPKELLDKM
jgi:hypothetical protein